MPYQERGGQITYSSYGCNYLCAQDFFIRGEEFARKASELDAMDKNIQLVLELFFMIPMTLPPSHSLFFHLRQL